MEWDMILEAVWSAVNSPIGIALVAMLVLWVLNKVYAKKPAWRTIEGSIIAAVKWAEKQIPDDSENKSLARLDAALRYAVKVYEEIEKRRATEAEIASIKEGIQIVHAQLEKDENL